MQPLSVSLLRTLAAPLLAGLLAVGCASPLSAAVTELESGRPAEADRRFRSLEPLFSELDSAERIRYALYRGLTHLTLGDFREAERWLDAAKRVADRDATALSDAERGRLLAAWRTMGRMPGEHGVLADVRQDHPPVVLGPAPGTSATAVLSRP